MADIEYFTADGERFVPEVLPSQATAPNHVAELAKAALDRVRARGPLVAIVVATMATSLALMPDIKPNQDGGKQDTPTYTGH